MNDQNKKEPIGLTFSGLMVYDDGSVDSQQGYLKKITNAYNDIFDDAYKDLLLFSPALVEELKKEFKLKATGLQAASPMICKGGSCPIKNTCPIYKIDDGSKAILTVLGRKCPIEIGLIKMWREQYITEFDVSPFDRTTLGLINQMAELELLEWRATEILSYGDGSGEGQDFMKEFTNGITQNGDELTKHDLHPLVNFKLLCQDKRLKIAKALVATPESKYKRDAVLKTKSVTSLDEQTATMKAKFNEMFDNFK